MERAHHRLARLHRKLGADYDGPDMSPPPKPKWMRWKTYSRISPADPRDWTGRLRSSAARSLSYSPTCIAEAQQRAERDLPMGPPH